MIGIALPQESRYPFIRPSGLCSILQSRNCSSSPIGSVQCDSQQRLDHADLGPQQPKWNAMAMEAGQAGAVPEISDVISPALPPLTPEQVSPSVQQNLSNEARWVL